MLPGLASRMLRETHPRLLGKFLWTFCWKGMRAVQAYEKRLKRGVHFPAVGFISVTNRCNLSCQGCWVTPTDPPHEIAPATLDRIIRDCKRQGSHFFGILGGEPLLYAPLMETLERHPDCYFQVFTNGMALTDDVAAAMRRLGNVTPLVSIEGNEFVSDERRGGKGVYGRALDALECCRRHRLITGVATSVCRSNIEDLASERFLRELIERGVHYMWYYIYRPAGSMPTPELALSEEQILTLRKFIVEMRCRVPLMILDAYWDHEGRALCPAAVGISHHINPAGDVEPCPPIQFAADNVADTDDLAELFANSAFLQRFRETAAETTRGCILLERPDLLKAFLQKENARDTTMRERGLDELAVMCGQPGHHIPGQEIPEKHWLYRFAKKHWFFGFGTYG